MKAKTSHVCVMLSRSLSNFFPVAFLIFATLVCQFLSISATMEYPKFMELSAEMKVQVIRKVGEVFGKIPIILVLSDTLCPSPAVMSTD